MGSILDELNSKQQKKKTVKKTTTKKKTVKKKKKIPEDLPIEDNPDEDIIPKTETIISVPSKRKRKIVTGDDEQPDDLSELINEAQRAKLEQEIHKAALGRYKAEKEKIAFMKKAGDIQETAFGEFLFYGYLEKLNLDILSMTKKLRPKLESLIKEKDVRGVIRLIDEEHTAILLEVQKAQAEDQKKWESEI